VESEQNDRWAIVNDICSTAAIPETSLLKDREIEPLATQFQEKRR
jgi:hypothetical protein